LGLIIVGIIIIAYKLLKMKKTVENSQDENKKSEKIYTIFFWVSGFSALLSVIAICGIFISKNVVIVNESIVLIFVGILATFVVVSNYAQVKDIERKFEEKAGEIESKFDEKTKKINDEFNTKVDSIIGIKKDIDKKIVDLNSEIENLKKENEKNYIICEIYFSILNGRVAYYSKNYTGALHEFMKGMHYFIESNKKFYGSYGDADYYLKLLTSTDISSTIKISKYEKECYIKILKGYNGSDKDYLINFIEGLNSIND